MKTSPAPSAPRRARVLVVDDHPIFREGLAELIQRQPNLTCCAQAGHAREVLSAVQQAQPDLLLLDLRLGDGDGLDLLPELMEHFPKLPVLLLSQGDEQLYAERALRAGARGYIMKEEAAAEVLNAIATVLAGKAYVSHALSVRIVAAFIEPGAKPKLVGMASLTNRELHIFGMIGAGQTTNEIAAELRLSMKTVQSHRENLKRKLQLPGGPALVRHATAWLEHNRGKSLP